MHFVLLLILGCYLSSLVTLLFGSFLYLAHQTLPGNRPAVTTLPAVLLSSKPLVPPLTCELKQALEGTEALTPNQVISLAALERDILLFE